MEGVTLEFVPLGDAEADLVQSFARDAARVYGLPHTVAAEPLPLPPAAFDPKREQYLADRLLAELKLRSTPANTHLLAITDADITVGDMNFLFGLADMPGNIAVMSLHRLRPKRRTEEAADLLLQRAVKIAVHELGHTFGFRHCPNEKCVMHYADTAFGVDLTDRTFLPPMRIPHPVE